LYKGLWSSFNDRNFFEIAWTLKRQFADDGLYPRLALYNFADNHDVNRVASSLNNRAHLRALYGILFCAPGIPSVYYGSEYGALGERDEHSDYALRPAWDHFWSRKKHAQDFFYAIAAFARVRRNSDALKNGNYRELLVASEQFAFARETQNERVIAAVNSCEDAREIAIPARALKDTKWRDALSGEVLNITDNELRITVHAADIRILRGMNA
jgi:glycosidase